MALWWYSQLNSVCKEAEKERFIADLQFAKVRGVTVQVFMNREKVHSTKPKYSHASEFATLSENNLLYEENAGA